MVAVSAIEPWLFGSFSATLLLLDLNIDELVTPVNHNDDPKKDIETLRRRLVQWALRPTFVKASKSVPPIVDYEDVQGTYNFNLSKLDWAEMWLDRFEEGVRHMRIGVKLAAISLLPAATYTSAIALSAVTNGLGGWVVGGSATAFAASGAIAAYAWMQLRRSRREFNKHVGEVETSLSTIQTLQMGREV